MQSCDTLYSSFALILNCLSPCFSCPRNREFLQKSGLSPYELDTALRAEMNSGGVSASLSLSALLGDDVTRFGEQDAAGPTGGYPWSCGGEEAISKFVPIFVHRSYVQSVWFRAHCNSPSLHCNICRYLKSPAVMKALHISNPGQSTFHYHSSGPASITLHPELATKIRVLIYNGDADACVGCFCISCISCVAYVLW